ncbi:E3 ubiquitin-protein ligase, related [Eimeria maxima]|uniref:HECT-type E3 ubiquitin transferase n=1 Tax=Eimeria maxima TaxID=5804 RepID=U6LZ58_EIMMA|nr:E3 ubiquitin-protein ligase, related [Eimeria maxima]CDJ57247.1 E3 ubiquitin-protein ligase, related [Eimeria maxima]
MALTFSYTSNVFGEYRDVALGTHSPTEVVSINNRTEYVEAYIHHVLSAAPASQFAAFKRGFFRCLDSNTLSLLLPQELQLLLLGSQQEISLAVLQKATRYQDGYSEDSLAIRRLWAILSNFTDKQKRQFLMFVTGSDRLPVGGAQALRLTIGRHGFDTDR